MAKSFLTPINLNKLEIQNVAAQNLATAPASPVKGQFYMNTTDNTLYWWDGTQWVAAKDAGGTGFPGYGPGGSTVAETTFGQAKADGVATTVARADHTHGSPVHDAAAHSTIPISALAPATTFISMGGNSIFNLAAPSSATDAANKQYVDSLVTGLAWKNPVRVATTANVTLSGLQAIDGVTVVQFDRVLVKNQTTASQNGIYQAMSGGWVRTEDADASAELVAAAVFVSEGSTQADTAWVQTTNAPITVGTTGLAWVQFASTVGGVPTSRQVIAGAGMTGGGALSADVTLNVIGDASITVAADAISRAALTGDVTAAAGANATTIANNAVTNVKAADMPAATMKGNSTAGVSDPMDLTVAQVKALLGYSATDIGAVPTTRRIDTTAPLTGGGDLSADRTLDISTFTATVKGAVPPPTTATGRFLKDDGTWAVASTLRKHTGLVAGTATTQQFTHNFGTVDVLVQVYRITTPFDQVECDVEHTDTNNVTIRFATAPAANEYRFTIIG